MKLLSTAKNLKIENIPSKAIEKVIVKVNEASLNLNLSRFDDYILDQFPPLKKEDLLSICIDADLTDEDIELMFEAIVSTVAHYLTTTNRKPAELIYLPRDEIRENVFLPLGILNILTNYEAKVDSFTISIWNKGELFWQMLKEE